MSEQPTQEPSLTRTGPVVPKYGEAMYEPAQQGGRPRLNEAAVRMADRQRYQKYLEKIAKAEAAGITDRTDQLTYEEINDFGSLQAKFG